MNGIVIFDMDGTLIDSSHDITVSINHVRRQHYNLEPLTKQFIVDAINTHKRNLAKMFYNEEQYHDKDRDLFEAHYYEQCDKNVYVYDQIPELLESLKVKGLRCSVATNAPTQFAKKMLTTLRLNDYFDEIIGADKVRESKPNSEMLEIILKQYGFDNAVCQAWMVGDNSKDMEAARRANIKGVFSLWGFSSSGTGDYVAQKPNDLLDIIDNY